MSAFSAVGPRRIRLRLILQTLFAFGGGFLLVKYTYDIERLKQAILTPKEKSLSTLQKINFEGEDLPICSTALKVKEETDKSQGPTFPISSDVTIHEAKNTKLQSVSTDVRHSSQELKSTSNTSHAAETAQSTLGSLKASSHIPETKSTLSAGLQTTKSNSEMRQTHAHSTSFVNGSQTSRVLICGQAPPEGLTQVFYDSAELESTFKRILPSTSDEYWGQIKPAMTSEERGIVLLLLNEFIKICDLYNITNYFIFSGTLLGSYHHHGLQPWDDDIDILMQHSDKERIHNEFFNYTKQSKVFVVKFVYSRMKLFHRTRSIPISGFRHQWPFLDVSFYHENETHIWEYNRGLKLEYHITPKALIFPLHLRPFEGVMINSPRDAFAILKLLFSDDQCVSLTWIHKTELAPLINPISFVCEEVAPIYPFVHRRVVGSCVEESLWLNDTVVYRILIEEPTYAIAMPFRLQLEQPPS